MATAIIFILIPVKTLAALRAFILVIALMLAVSRTIRPAVIIVGTAFVRLRIRRASRMTAIRFILVFKTAPVIRFPIGIVTG